MPTLRALFYVLAFLALTLVLVLLLACSRPAPIVPKQIDVRVVSLPERTRCWLEDAPSVPEPITLNYDDDDIIRRAFVSVRQHNDLVAWIGDLANWMESVNACVVQLSGER